MTLRLIALRVTETMVIKPISCNNIPLRTPAAITKKFADCPCPYDLASTTPKTFTQNTKFPGEIATSKPLR